MTVLDGLASCKETLGSSWTFNSCGSCRSFWTITSSWTFSTTFFCLIDWVFQACVFITNKSGHAWLTFVNIQVLTRFTIFRCLTTLRWRCRPSFADLICVTRIRNCRSHNTIVAFGAKCLHHYIINSFTVITGWARNHIR